MFFELCHRCQLLALELLCYRDLWCYGSSQGISFRSLPHHRPPLPRSLSFDLVWGFHPNQRGFLLRDSFECLYFSFLQSLNCLFLFLDFRTPQLRSIFEQKLSVFAEIRSSETLMGHLPFIEMLEIFSKLLSQCRWMACCRFDFRLHHSIWQTIALWAPSTQSHSVRFRPLTLSSLASSRLHCDWDDQFKTCGTFLSGLLLGSVKTIVFLVILFRPYLVCWSC